MADDYFEAYDPVVKPPYVRQKYPRLRSEESDVLRAYIQEIGPEKIERLRTAVPVGRGEGPEMPEDPWDVQRKALSQWKIDAVIDYPGKQEIIELKSRATHTSLGQLLAYDLSLGERDDEPTSSVMKVVSFRQHPDLARIARMLNIQFHTVPDADRSTATRRFLRDVGLTDE